MTKIPKITNKNENRLTNKKKYLQMNQNVKT